MSKKKNNKLQENAEKQDIILENQFKRAKRNLIQEERHENEEKALSKFSYVDAANEKSARVKKFEEAKSGSAPFLVTENMTNCLNPSAGDLCLYAHTTGDAKTTTAVNATFQAIRRGLKVMYVSNEETIDDFVKKLTCLEVELHPGMSNAWSPGELKRYNEAKTKLLNDKNLVIIDDGFKTANGGEISTSTVRGVVSLLKEIEQRRDIDLFIFDYFQNISREPDYKSEYYALFDLTKKFDYYKGRIGCPIVVFAQLRPPSKAETELEQRIKLCREIIVKATIAIEGCADKSRRVNYWKIYKLRHPKDGVVEGTVFRTIWHKGGMYDPTSENLLKYDFAKTPPDSKSPFSYDLQYQGNLPVENEDE